MSLTAPYLGPTNLAAIGEFVIAVHRQTCYTPNEKQLFTQGAFDKTFRTVLTGLTAIERSFIRIRPTEFYF